MPTTSFAEFSQLADYSLMESLRADPQASSDGDDHVPRQVYSGHYVPVTPTAIPEAEYLAHSSELFKELGLTKSDDDEALIAAMAANPILIERPMAISRTKAVIGRPPEQVLTLLDS